MYSNRSFTVPVLPTCRESVPQVTCGAKLMSPALGAPNAQRRQTTLRFEGRLGLSGLPPPEFGSPTGGLSPCHGSQALCRPERRLRGLPAIGPLASANRSPWLQELIRHCTRIYCCLPHLKISTRRYSSVREKIGRRSVVKRENVWRSAQIVELHHKKWGAQTKSVDCFLAGARVLSSTGSRGSRGGYPLAALGSEDWCDAIHAGVFSGGRPSVHGVAPSPTAPASSRVSRE